MHNRAHAKAAHLLRLHHGKQNPRPLHRRHRIPHVSRSAPPLRPGRTFTRKYKTHRLVYFQSFHNIGDAIARETDIKNWRREKKTALIEERNPTWEDLAEGWGEPALMRVKAKEA
jgi:hypothetical protein